MKSVKIFLSALLIFLLQPGILAKSDRTKKDDDIIDTIIVKNGITVTEIREDGKELFEFTGSHAESLSKNVLRVYNVNATIIQDDGSEILIMTEVADYNKEKRELVTDKYVEIISNDGIMTGVGMYLNNDKNLFRLLSDVTIEPSKKSDDLGLTLP